VGSRTSLDAVEKRTISCTCRESNTGRPARIPTEPSQLLSNATNTLIFFYFFFSVFSPHFFLL
jgi:hypothetical protein